MARNAITRPKSIATKPTAFMENQNVPLNALTTHSNKKIITALLPKQLDVIPHNERNHIDHSLTAYIKHTVGDYTIGRQVGQGAYAQVKEAIHKSTGKKYAIKIYEKFRLHDTQRKRSVNNEINILKKIDHMALPNYMNQ